VNKDYTRQGKTLNKPVGPRWGQRVLHPPLSARKRSSGSTAREDW